MSGIRVIGKHYISSLNKKPGTIKKQNFKTQEIHSYIINDEIIFKTILFVLKQLNKTISKRPLKQKITNRFLNSLCQIE